MRLAFNVTVNSYDARPTAPGFRIFFQLKRASRKPFQIPCVFSMKRRRAFKVIVNSHVIRKVAKTTFASCCSSCVLPQSVAKGLFQCKVALYDNVDTMRHKVWQKGCFRARLHYMIMLKCETV